jgi:hypothetical protein
MSDGSDGEGEIMLFAPTKAKPGTLLRPSLNLGNRHWPNHQKEFSVFVVLILIIKNESINVMYCDVI